MLYIDTINNLRKGEKIMDKKLLNKLRCVKCYSNKLIFDEKKNKIRCLNCGKEYDIVEDIPIMLPEDNGIKDYNVEVFEKHTDKYDRWFDASKGSTLFKNELETFRIALKNKNLGEALEIGVGTGRFAEKLDIKYGVDPSIEALKFAAKRGVKVVEGIAENLPFSNKTFNSVFIIVTICFVKDAKKTISEAYRVLKNNGTITVGFVNRESPWGKLYLEKKSSGHLFYRNVNLFSTEEIVSILEKHNFNIISQYSTLNQEPSEKPKFEKPSNNGNGGFVVVVAKK